MWHNAILEQEPEGPTFSHPHLRNSRESSLGSSRSGALQLLGDHQMFKLRSSSAGITSDSGRRTVKRRARTRTYGHSDETHRASIASAQMLWNRKVSRSARAKGKGSFAFVATYTVFARSTKSPPKCSSFKHLAPVTVLFVLAAYWLGPTQYESPLMILWGKGCTASL